MALDDNSHRPGIWKQQNKGHKTGRHRSKGQIDTENKGRVSVKTLTRKAKREQGKINRRHHAQQRRSKKRDEILQEKRNLGGRDSPPHLVAVIPLHHDTDVGAIMEKIKTSNDEDATFHKAEMSSGGFTINIPRLKHRFKIICPASSSIPDMLDCGLVADTILFLLSPNAEEPVDEHGQSCLSTLFAQGLSASVLATSGLEKIPIKKRSDVKKGMLRAIDKNFPDSKIHSLDTNQEVQILLRLISDHKRKKLNIRHKRPYLLADNFNFECEGEENAGTLCVTGHLRGECLDVNRLIHIVGWGDFHIKKVDAAVDSSLPVKERKGKKKEMDCDSMTMDDCNSDSNVTVTMKSQETIATSNPEARQDLIREAEVDPLNAEQTWPTEEEMREVEEEALKKKKLTKKVPKGTSEYQAAWILDSDEEWKEKDEEDDEDNEEMNMSDDELKPTQQAESQVGSDNEEEYERIRVSESSQATDNVLETASQYDDKMDMDEESQDFKRYTDERSHQMFPDEVDTPHDLPARVRFQRYRGLRSFRTSPWDRNENLPDEYGRIFQFQNFDRTRKRIRNIDVDNLVKPGMYVTIHVENVPRAFVEAHSTECQVIIYGLFPHEQKMSVLHMALKRQEGRHENLSVKNKDEMLFYVGFRKFRARPIFSQHTTGDKHKLERFFPREGVAMASVYAQIVFPSANVIMFKESSAAFCNACVIEQGVLPIGTGTLYKVDPGRVVTKRIVLSGHPFRIHKRLATIRYMFFNPEDINWFKPIELYTKMGRRGHIKEALGTHGHMKCTFDSQLNSQDTVLLSLYKRIFPKWSYVSISPINRVKDFASSESSSFSLNRVKEVMFDEEFFDD